MVETRTEKNGIISLTLNSPPSATASCSTNKIIVLCKVTGLFTVQYSCGKNHNMTKTWLVNQEYNI